MSQATALVPAAGFGTRFHEGGPKALVLLGGKPLLVHALERLAASRRVANAVIAIPGGCEESFHAALKTAPLPYALVEGGVTRRESGSRAFAATEPKDDDLVLVHDAARPLVDPLEVKAVVDAADATGAAIAAFSLVETIKRVESGKIRATVSRSDLVAATTPQAFRAAILRKGLAKEGGADATDDAELVERAGGAEVTVVLASRWNIKITYPEDLAWAEAWLGRAGG